MSVSTQQQVSVEKPTPGYLVFITACLWITTSATLIACNKYLMTENRFPQPTALVTMHMGSGFLFTVLLRLIKPSLYPTWDVLVNDTRGVLTRMFPIAVCCAVSFVLSNVAYIYVSVALLQILKELNIVMVYIVSLVMALTVWNWRVAAVIAAILVFCGMAVTGDLSFMWIGVIMQLTSQGFEVGKIVLMNFYLASGSGTSQFKKLDQLTLLMVITPFAFCMLAIVQAIRWDPIILEQAGNHWPVLIVNMLIAFSLNVIVVTFLKISNGVTFTLTGLAKDILIVSSSAFIFHDALSTLQVACFAVSLGLILFYSLMKLYPTEFQESYTAGLSKIGGNLKAYMTKMPKSELTEKFQEAAKLEEAQSLLSKEGEKQTA